MTSRLQAQWRRLYVPECLTPAAEAPVAVAEPAAGDDTSLIDTKGRVRAMVLALSRPANWEALSAVWQAVQAELSLPAPAIAVTGVDGYQLWFSLAEAVPVAEARAFLEALRQRHLSHIAPARIDLLPALVSTDGRPRPWHTGMMMPGQEADVAQWSAFVAPDLAPVFAETPWLDVQPSLEGQADLLSSLRSIKHEDWEAALAALGVMPMPTASNDAARAIAAAQDAQEASPSAAEARHGVKLEANSDPRRFLLSVMNDDSVALALRIEAAKALLPYTTDARS